jgi:hypothetical protein
MAGALGIFMLAMTLLMWYGRGIDDMFSSLTQVQLPGQVIEESGIDYE